MGRPLDESAEEVVAWNEAVVGGGEYLVTVSAEPPAPWTLTLYEVVEH